ncbi:hypothetical protein THIOM_001154 [Candidatus Thiomargarita nelsonii]|uniref:Uncharacterized protein n=1 Tax=Candidatus Thiomargarita nelsonii TaxID=1003181 RepID=A0A176S4H6_9GAMM|nr:hypothetical protein THIOM_001154 [Candidatus Thiomargarita nelsonii]
MKPGYVRKPLDWKSSSFHLEVKRGIISAGANHLLSLQKYLTCWNIFDSVIAQVRLGMCTPKSRIRLAACLTSH